MRNKTRSDSEDDDLSSTVDKPCNFRGSENTSVRYGSMKVVKPYKERIRLREIDKSNRRLLKNVIHMEKNFLKLKRTMKEKQGASTQDFGLRPEHLSSTMQTNMRRSFYHTTNNRK